jgi:hypothetical protein
VTEAQNELKLVSTEFHRPLYVVSLWTLSPVTGLFPSICISSIDISQLSELRLLLLFIIEGVCV